MTRTHAEALALVNWKGVFYERYLLDRHVTALEGANGAGKTTVMIAAYVVLLPDMSRLRFTNLGETGATGGDKGIWGRLGEPGRPSYAVLDFALPGKRRLVAGVHLERKGEPSVEPTPFIVAGAGGRRAPAGLAPRLAGRERGRARAAGAAGERGAPRRSPHVVPVGARLLRRALRSGRHAAAARHRRGAQQAERDAAHEHDRRHLAGADLGAALFLLKEEGGLADTLQRMRANLDACRRTRTEVQESRRLEQEIGGVFEAGQTMFAAAFLATRERADELSRRVEEAEAARANAEAAQYAARDALEKTLADLEALERRRGELGQVVDSARAWQGKLRDALTAAKALVRCAETLKLADAASATAAHERAVADERRARAREELRRAQEGYKRTAAGLADVQRGIEELHRRAGAYHQAVRRLREAESSLGGAPLLAPVFDERLGSARAELAAVDEERREAATLLADAESHRGRHAEAMRALTTLVGAAVAPEQAHDVALDALTRHRENVALAGRLSNIEQQLGDARRLAARQAKAREQAAALDVVIGGRPAGEVVSQLLDEVEGTRKDHEEKARIAEAEALAKERELKELEARRRELATREPVWRMHAERAARLGEHLVLAVDNRERLHAARTELATRLGVTHRAEEDARVEQERLLHEARELLAAGGPFAAELLKLKDKLGAELVAASFDDVSLNEAARLEARLGGLAQALVVDDPKASAQALAQRPDALADVLLVSRDADLERLAATADAAVVGDRDVAVEHGAALRVSRIPTHPRLGRRAREQRAAELRREADLKARELEEQRGARRQLERLVADGEELLTGHAVWLAGDPAPELVSVKRAITEAEAYRDVLRSAAARHQEAARTLRPRLDGLRVLLGEAMLLDPPDHGERARALEVERDAARGAKDAVARLGRHADLVDRHLATLRQVPLSDDDVLRLQERVRELKARRDQLDAGLDALTYVQANGDALGWEEAPRRLADSQALVPALEAQLREAESEQQRAEEARARAEQRYDDATGRFQDADGKKRVAVQEHAAAVERFERVGVPDPTEQALEAATVELDRLEQELHVAPRVAQPYSPNSRRFVTPPTPPSPMRTCGSP
jgi:chromosome partition protein MukB